MNADKFRNFTEMKSSNLRSTMKKKPKHKTRRTSVKKTYFNKNARKYSENWKELSKGTKMTSFIKLTLPSKFPLWPKTMCTALAVPAARAVPDRPSHWSCPKSKSS